MLKMQRYVSYIFEFLDKREENTNILLKAMLKTQMRMTPIERQLLEAFLRQESGEDHVHHQDSPPGEKSQGGTNAPGSPHVNS